VPAGGSLKPRTNQPLSQPSFWGFASSLFVPQSFFHQVLYLNRGAIQVIFIFQSYPPMTMARMTVNASKAVTKSTQMVSPQQSTEATQIMMTSTICTIAFLRELLPERYFDKRIITTGGEKLSHNQFIDQSDAQDEESQPPEGSTVTMIFKRGASQRADQILQLLVSMLASHGGYEDSTHV